jgi:RNA polymerase primary sigma factor
MKQLKITQKITDRNSSKAFNQYLADVRAIKPFETPDEEYECAVKAKNGDESALNDLITKNLKFVISVAKQYSTSKISLEELVNEGNYGLVEASKRFEPNKGFKFISYAVWYVRKNIAEYLTKNSRAIRIPVNKVGSLQKLKQNIAELEQIHQRPIIASDLIGDATNKDFDLDDINLLFSIDSINISSLDTPFDSEESGGTLIDVIENKDSMFADHIIRESDSKMLIESAMSKLSWAQRLIINHTFGLDGEQTLTLIEIGEKVGMSREGVRQTRNKALRLLKNNLKLRGIKIDEFL